MFFAAPFTIARHGSSVNIHRQMKWIRKMSYIYIQWNINHKEIIAAFCSNVDATRDDHTKWNKSEKDKYHTSLTCAMLSPSVVSDSCDPIVWSPPGSSVHGSSGRNTGVGCHFLLQGIFLTRESNLSLLHCRQILYWLSYEGSPCSLYMEPKNNDTCDLFVKHNQTHRLQKMNSWLPRGKSGGSNKSRVWD